MDGSDILEGELLLLQGSLCNPYVWDLQLAMRTKNQAFEAEPICAKSAYLRRQPRPAEMKRIRCFYRLIIAFQTKDEVSPSEICCRMAVGTGFRS